MEGNQKGELIDISMNLYRNSERMGVVTVIEEFGYKFKGKRRNLKKYNVITYQLNHPEELEEFLLLTSKDSPYRTHIRVSVNPHVIDLVPKGVWLGKPWGDVEIGEDLPLHIKDLSLPIPNRLPSYKEFILHKEKEKDKFNILVGAWESDLNILVIDEVEITHFKGYTLYGRKTNITSPYTLKLSAVKKLSNCIGEGLIIRLGNCYLLPKAERLIDRTIYCIDSIRKELALTPGVIEITLKRREAMELIYDSNYGS